MVAHTHATRISTAHRARQATGPAMGTLTAPAPPQPRTGSISWTRRAAKAGTGSAHISGPEPRLRQLMGVCGWAAVLGGVGLVVGLRGFIGVLAGEPPTWYEPSMIAVGLTGIGLTMGGFLTVARKGAPWVALALASGALIVSMVLTSRAF